MVPIQKPENRRIPLVERLNKLLMSVTTIQRRQTCIGKDRVRHKRNFAKGVLKEVKRHRIDAE